MNTFFINISLLLILLTTNQLFSAGAHLSIASEKIKKIVCNLHTIGLLGIAGKSGNLIINKGATTDYDTIPQVDFLLLKPVFGPGFSGIDWTEFLEQPDSNGNTSIKYELTLPSVIEGIEGWRNWTFRGDGKIDIGSSGALRAFGLLYGKEISRE